jgi:zinc D-Ala-D-Ala carboxypeptidase
MSRKISKMKQTRFVSLFVLVFAVFAPTGRLQIPLPDCAYKDVHTQHQDYEDFYLTLLDTTYKLPKSYAPPDLVPVSEAGLAGDYEIRAIVIPDLKALVQAARAAGKPVEIQSAYRSYSYQEETFQYWVAEDGYKDALASSARPGHSEHQLGTSLDFRDAGGPAPWELADWATTPAGSWMASHAWEYGFVLSYPPNQQEVVCYVYEPWHYRYVGRNVAQAVKESGLTLREWLWQHQ